MKPASPALSLAKRNDGISLWIHVTPGARKPRGAPSQLSNRLASLASGPGVG